MEFRITKAQGGFILSYYMNAREVYYVFTTYEELMVALKKLMGI